MDQAKNNWLKNNFLACYPSDLVHHKTMPSIRDCCPWCIIRFSVNSGIGYLGRLTVAKADELSQQRQAKLPKLELASLHILLVDEPLSIDTSNGTMGINSVRNRLAVHDMAVAMCGGARLANLKAYQHKFVGFLTQRIDAETMRCASITESQAADRQIWGVLSDLMRERGWSMDVASQLAEGTLFLSYPKEELESKFLVDPPLRACSVFVCESVQQTSSFYNN